MTPGRCAWVVGTFDTKEEELLYIARLMNGKGVQVRTVDIGPRSASAAADITAQQVAQWHPGGVEAVRGGSDRALASPP